MKLAKLFSRNDVNEEQSEYRQADCSLDDFKFISEDDFLFNMVFVVCVTLLSIYINDDKIQIY